MVNVVVIGTGKMAHIHVKEWANVQGATVVGVVGRNEAVLQNMKKQFQVETYTNIDTILQNNNVDLVDICLPTYLHYEYVKKAAEAGKDILCEKPLGRSLEEIKNMIQICEESLVKLFVGHQLRFLPEYEDARKKVQEGAIGNVGVVRLSRGTAYPVGRDWYKDGNKSGGVILDLGIHDFEWLRATFGEVERVMALRNVEDVGEKHIEDALITLRFKSGAIGHLELSWGRTESESSFELAGKDGMISFDSHASNPITLQRSDTGPVQPNKLIQKSPISLQFEHILECIKENKEPVVTVNDAYKAVEIALSALESAETKQPVTISDGEVY